MFKSSYGTKFSTYTLYVKQTDQTAVYYEMMGYDTLLGSHFDEYKVLYSKVSENFAPDVFDEEIKGMQFITTFFARSVRGVRVSEPF